MDILIEEEEDMQYFASLLFSLVHSLPQFYLFCSGDYGVGKTTFIKALAEQYPSQGEFEVSSPSFTTYNIYPTNPPLLHIDLYNSTRRLEDIMEEVEEEDIRIICIEWPSSIGVLPDEAVMESTITYGNSKEQRAMSSQFYNIDTNAIEGIYSQYNDYYKDKYK